MSSAETASGDLSSLPWSLSASAGSRSVLVLRGGERLGLGGRLAVWPKGEAP